MDRSRACLVNLLLGLLLVISAIPSLAVAPSATAQTPASPFGVNGHVASRYGIYQKQQVPLDVMAAHNVSWSREEFRWDMVNPAPGRWDWGFTDEMVAKASERDINILGLLVYSVGWASPAAGVGSNQPAFTMPANLDTYHTYVQTVVSRYRGRVKAWEVWNEPNHGAFWRPQPDAAEYARLLQTAASAIRTADPNAKVVLGGIAGADTAFLEQVVAIAGWNSFDIVAAHPYVAPRSPERGYLADGELARLEAFVDRHGGGKSIWLTEIGWPSSRPGRWGVGDPAVQANYLVRGMVQAAASPRVERVFWYNWRNDGTDPNNDEDNYGLVANDWRTPKPAATAFRTLSGQLDGARKGRPLDLAAGTRTVINDFDGDQPWHIWGDAATGRVERGEGRRGGSARVHYDLSKGSQAYVDFQNIREAPGRPTTLGVWVRGDSSGHLLWATFRDAQGEQFRLYLGAIGTGWQLRQGVLGAYANNDGDGVIQFPVRFQSFIVDDEPDRGGGSGAIEFDDLLVEEGPEVYGYRFTKGEGHVDVLWAIGSSANLALPTASSTATVTNRDGQSQTVAATNGVLPLTLGEAPIFVEHRGRTETTPATPAPPPTMPHSEAGDPPAAPTDASFSQVWATTDQAVQQGQVNRSWLWGPGSYRTTTESYAQSPGGRRLVEYYDKARMEINNPNGDRGNLFFVTNGLLPIELMTGRLKTGDDVSQYEQRDPAEMPVAGDPAESNTAAPTYQSFNSVSSVGDAPRRASPAIGSLVVATLNRAGEVGQDETMGGYGVRIGSYNQELGHNVPDVFQRYLESLTLPAVFVMGYPISEPYWAKVRVGGVERDVLMQAFERRVLTYTPSNGEGFQVEMGNVGQHYYRWRYGTTPWNR